MACQIFGSLNFRSELLKPKRPEYFFSQKAETLISLRPTSQAQSAKKMVPPKTPRQVLIGGGAASPSPPPSSSSSPGSIPPAARCKGKLKVELNQKKEKYAKANLLRKTGYLSTTARTAPPPC